MVRYPSPSADDSSSSSSYPSFSSPSPQSWRGYKEEGSKYFNEGNYEHALASYRNALNPEYHIPDAEKQILLSNIVCCRLKIGGRPMASAAVEEAKQCIALNNRWAKGHIRLASAYITLGDHSNDACNSLQRALQLEPQNKIARQMLLAELRRDREGRSQPFDSAAAAGGSATSSSGVGGRVAPSAPPMEDPQHEEEIDVYSHMGSSGGAVGGQQQQQDSFSHDEYSSPTPSNDYMGSPSAPPPPNDYMGSPSAPPPPSSSSSSAPNDYMGSSTNERPPPPHNPYSSNNYNNNNTDNINIDESLSLSNRIQFYFVRFTSWYQDSLSDDTKTLLKVIFGILILYVAFGGRFGLDSALGGVQKGNRGNYGSNNVYERYNSGRRVTEEYGSGYNDRSRGNYNNKGGYGSSSYSSTSNTGYNDARRGSSSSSSSYSRSSYNDDYSYTSSSRRSSYNSGNSYHFPNLFDGSPASMAIILGIGFICHKFGINPFQVFMLLRLAGGGRRRGRMGMGYGGMAGMGMGYGMANNIYRRHYGAGAGGVRRGG